MKNNTFHQRLKNLTELCYRLNAENTQLKERVEAAKTILKEYDNNFLFIPEEAIRQLKNLFEETTK